jgi:hypothetical protein
MLADKVTRKVNTGKREPTEPVEEINQTWINHFLTLLVLQN